MIQGCYCGLGLRIMVIIYDSILLFSIYFFAVGLLILIFDEQIFLTLSKLGFYLFLLAIAYIYYVWQWVAGRQTLSMKTWRIDIVNEAMLPLNWQQASYRFILAIISIMLLGFGLVWSLFDKDHITFYDRYSKTYLLVQQVA